MTRYNIITLKIPTVVGNPEYFKTVIPVESNSAMAALRDFYRYYLPKPEYKGHVFIGIIKEGVLFKTLEMDVVFLTVQKPS
jgi:hypothetical protein